jgi:esterase
MPTEELEHLRLAASFAGVPVAEFVLPEHHHTVLSGIRLHYLDWGTRGERPILFLHGGALTAHTWDLICLALRTRYHCLALDQRGHGDSEWSPAMDYSLEAHVGDIAAFIDSVGLERPVLVGQSMGAMNALAFSARHPDAIGALVLVDVGARVREGAWRIAEFVLAPAELDSVDDFVARARDFNRLRRPELLRQSLLHNLRRLPNGRLTWKYDRRPLSAEWLQELAARYLALLEECARVRCPVLVVRGALSEVITDEDAADLAARFPDGRWGRVEEAAHTVQGDNPEGFVAELMPFLEGTPIG